jgi:hypothetical protein
VDSLNTGVVNDEIHMSVLQWAERLRDRKIIGPHYSPIHFGEITHTFCLAQ